MDTKRRREGGMNWEFGIGLYIQELCKYKIGNEREPGGVPGGTVVKNPPAVQETRVQSLGREDPLEGGHGNPLQCSCLENPRDRGAWRTTVHGVTKSRLQLK